VPVTVNRHAWTELSTAEVSTGDAFAYWREMISSTFVRLTADPVARERFAGRIEHVPVGDLELSTVTAGGQHVRRTRRLIAGSDEEYVLASIQLRGRGRVEQDGRVAELSEGDMAFYDSARPYDLRFEGPFSQLVLQVPRRDLAIRSTRNLTARVLAGSGTPSAAVVQFFTTLAKDARQNADQISYLLPHAVGLLGAAAAMADRTDAGPEALVALARERVHTFLRQNLADSALDAEIVANACHVSRRTLYRIVGEEGVRGHLRRLRIERAQALLLADPARPASAVAAECGFDSESGFYRAFRDALALTPGAYRAAAGRGTPRK
jgi:AraC-like DNA-binding protein